MSEKVSQFLKRTCLICGCHTNQTINIYEPRSGPNIVKLIQEKFKFQPLNDDKYLCFSCNNWLINWHSLQAVNSNESEQSSDINSIVEEKGAGAAQQQRQAKFRPIAQVKPLQLLESKMNSQHDSFDSGKEIEMKPSKSENTVKKAQLQYKKSSVLPMKRKFLLRKKSYNHRNLLFRHKNLRNCLCDKVSFRRSQSLKESTRKATTEAKYGKLKMKEESPNKFLNSQSLVMGRNSLSQRDSHSQNSAKTAIMNMSKNYLQHPMVDGKVVSMLRRLGTTISREQHNAISPPIMSPIKQKPIWMRQLEDDEIVLSFDDNLSEVLPSKTTQNIQGSSSKAKRKLVYTSQVKGSEGTLTNSNTLHDLNLPDSLIISVQ